VMMSKKEKNIPDKDAASGQEEKSVTLTAEDHQKLLDELAEYKDKYVRLIAEFENSRKRNERERMEFAKYANEGLVAEFLGIMDDLERSVAAVTGQHQDHQAFLKGIEMVMAHIYEMLKKHNVQPIEALGKKFDPHCHEVLMQEETEDHEDQTVIEEFQKGYLLGDRVVRTAKVKVAVRK